MSSQLIKQQKHRARVRRIRSKVVGSAKRPRLVASRSNAGMYVQLIDDTSGKTLFAIKDSDLKGSNKTERAFAAGKSLAEQAVKKGISQAVFDRAGFAYHGRVAAVAEGARKGGLRV